MRSYLISSAVCGLLAALPALIVCLVKKYKTSKSLYIVLLTAYIVALVCLTLICGEQEPSRKVQIIPFITLLKNLKYHNSSYVIQMIGTIVMYIPMGIFTGLKYKNLRFTILASFLSSLVIETTQLITMRGVFDIDDLICNILGAIIGFMIISCFMKNFEKRKEIS